MKTLMTRKTAGLPKCSLLDPGPCSVTRNRHRPAAPKAFDKPHERSAAGQVRASGGRGLTAPNHHGSMTTLPGRANCLGDPGNSMLDVPRVTDLVRLWQAAGTALHGIPPLKVASAYSGGCAAFSRSSFSCFIFSGCIAHSMPFSSG